MADKTTCPACGYHSSAVLRAFNNGDPCPNCELSAEAHLEIISARARGADKYLVQRLTEASARADKAEAQLRNAERKLEAVRDALAQDYPDERSY